MPFVRLILIYVVVIFAAVAFFNRDAVLGLVGMSTEQPMSETETVSIDPFAAAPAAQAEPMTQSTSEEMPVATSDEPAAPMTQPVVAEATHATTAPMATTAVYDEQLTAARQAYWNGDAAKAEELYKALAAEFASEADVQGELGNLFFTQRRMDEAAEHFFNAGKLSVEAGNFPQAQAMIGVLQGIAPAKANDLRTLASNR